MLADKLRDFAVVRRNGRLHLVFEFDQGRVECEQPGRETL